ncbi:hypothetical protein [Neomoorella humiferrea]|uniref:Flagellar hook-length control protein FliK n=1 Tax=Neomoorella humiferrea TaxID=676965 RepID=A0A2T0ASP1_9FIRM|nr:hypothetical protein [Moorella humiferrea]PRR73115.1 hypothetical protein MOHU_12420 [Moorella humiferrea]
MNLILSHLGIGADKAIGTSWIETVKDNQKLDWEVGQILQGKVLGQRGTGCFILELEGREILARTSLFLSPGDLVRLQVQERQGNLYMVKLLSEGELTTNDTLGDILARLGLKDTPLQRSLVQKFIDHRLPLQQELLGQAKQALALLGSEDKEGIEVVLQAIKMGVLQRTDALKPLQEFMLGEKNPEQSGITRLARFIPLLTDLIYGLSGKRGEEARLLYQELRTFVSSLVLNPEEGVEKVAEQLLNLISSQLPARDGVVPSRPIYLNDLIEKLERLLQAIQESNREAGQSADSKLLETGKDIARQLVGQQIFQCGIRNDELQSCFYFTLPMLKNNEVTTWGQLVIKKEGRGNSPDRQNFNISILVNTESLGCLLLEMSIRQREVRVQGKVEEEWVGRLIKESWPALQEAFARLGYHLHEYNWKQGIVPRCLLPLETASRETGFQIGFLDKRV